MEGCRILGPVRPPLLPSACPPPLLPPPPNPPPCKCASPPHPITHPIHLDPIGHTSSQILFFTSQFISQKSCLDVTVELWQPAQDLKKSKRQFGTLQVRETLLGVILFRQGLGAIPNLFKRGVRARAAWRDVGILVSPQKPHFM